MTEVKSVPDALSDLGNVYRERNAVYGSTYEDFGKLLMALFPAGIEIRDEQQANRLGIVLHLADKLARYCRTVKQGGHPDSLDDLSVYSQMLREYDAKCKAETYQRLSRLRSDDDEAPNR